MRTERNTLAFLLLVESQQVAQKKKLIPVCVQTLKRHPKELLETFFGTFIENSKASRISLFKDPFFKHLWKIFAKNQTCFIDSFLSSMIE